MCPLLLSSAIQPLTLLSGSGDASADISSARQRSNFSASVAVYSLITSTTIILQRIVPALEELFRAIRRNQSKLSKLKLCSGGSERSSRSWFTPACRVKDLFACYSNRYNSLTLTCYNCNNKKLRGVRVIYVESVTSGSARAIRAWLEVFVFSGIENV